MRTGGGEGGRSELRVEVARAREKLTSEDRNCRSLPSDGLSKGSDDDDDQLESVLKRERERRRREESERGEEERAAGRRAHHLLSSNNISEPSEKKLTDESSYGSSDLKERDRQRAILDGS